MYPYNFKPEFQGINHREVFVVMPFDNKYDDIFSKLINPAVEMASNKLEYPEKQKLFPFRTKDDISTTSGWINVLEHLLTAQVIIGVLTDNNPNVFYELGIAHSTEPIERQILIANKDYKPLFDTKDLIFYKYDENNLDSCIEPLATRLTDAIKIYSVSQERKIKQIKEGLAPHEFELMRIYAVHPNFVIPFNKKTIDIYKVKYNDKRFFDSRIIGIEYLCHNGLLKFNWKPITDNSFEYSYWWSRLGNDVLFSMELINEEELEKRRTSDIE